MFVAFSHHKTKHDIIWSMILTKVIRNVSKLHKFEMLDEENRGRRTALSQINHKKCDKGRVVSVEFGQSTSYRLNNHNNDSTGE